jgi:hypothetical protein
LPGSGHSHSRKVGNIAVDISAGNSRIVEICSTQKWSIDDAGSTVIQINPVQKLALPHGGAAC